MPIENGGQVFKFTTEILNVKGVYRLQRITVFKIMFEMYADSL